MRSGAYNGLFEILKNASPEEIFECIGMNINLTSSLKDVLIEINYQDSLDEQIRDQVRWEVIEPDDPSVVSLPCKLQRTMRHRLAAEVAFQLYLSFYNLTSNALCLPSPFSKYNNPLGISAKNVIAAIENPIEDGEEDE